jgi:hypothetical protein
MNASDYFEEDLECNSCGRQLPRKFIQPFFSDGYYFQVCVVCADGMVPGGLQISIASDLLKEQKEWEIGQTGF